MSRTEEEQTGLRGSLHQVRNTGFTRASVLSLDFGLFDQDCSSSLTKGSPRLGVETDRGSFHQVEGGLSRRSAEAVFREVGAVGGSSSSSSSSSFS